MSHKKPQPKGKYTDPQQVISPTHKNTPCKSYAGDVRLFTIQNRLTGRKDF